MDRRNFIKGLSITVVSAAVTPSFVGCQAIAGIGTKTVGKWFLGFATAITASVIADSVAEWALKKDENEQSVVNYVNEIMINSGFINSDNATVFEKNGVSFYEFGHKDNFNGCVPFFDGIKRNSPMVEGPTIMGMALAAEELRRNDENKPTEIANALVPVQQIQRPTQNAFSYDYDQEYVALTDFGSMIVDYENKGSNDGMVTISLMNRSGVQEYGRQYDIEFV